MKISDIQWNIGIRQPVSGKDAVAFANAQGVFIFKHASAAKGLGTQKVFAGTLAQQGLQQAFHTEVSTEAGIAKTGSHTGTARWIDKVVHAADAGYRIVEADRNTGPQDGVQQSAVFDHPGPLGDVDGILQGRTTGKRELWVSHRNIRAEIHRQTLDAPAHSPAPSQGHRIGPAPDALAAQHPPGSPAASVHAPG